MKRFCYIYILMICGLFVACGNPKEITIVDELPPIYPDYTEVAIPYNIAPLNFLLRNKPSLVEVSIKGDNSSIFLRSGYKVQFAQRRWRKVLEAEKGGRIQVQIKAKVDGVWLQYASFSWQVTQEKIDPILNYQLIEPSYEFESIVQICERNLESFQEQVVETKEISPFKLPADEYYVNSRWLVFVSNWDDGVYGKLYFTYINKEGKIHKPFVLPQKDPAYYDFTLKSLDIPDLSMGLFPLNVHYIKSID